MNSSYLWIVFPLAMAVLCMFFQRRESLVAFIGTLTTIGLAGLAIWLPSTEQIAIGPWILQFADTWTVFGRRFVLAAVDRPTITVMYLATGLWLGSVPLAKPGRLFVPFCMGIVALLTAAIAVEPFLYAALLIGMVVLLSIPFLITPGEKVGRGVIRYLTFQILGIPFILFAGWMLTGVEGTPVDQDLILRTTAFLGLGFAFLLAVFPFHTWIPMLARESHPYAAAFVFMLLPGSISLFGLSFLERFAWLGDIEGIYTLFRVVGAVMIFTAGSWSIFQRDLGKLLGYALLLDIGFALMALSQTQGGAQSEGFRGLFYTGMIPRGLSLGVWALALSDLRRKAGGLDFSQVSGFGRDSPLLMAGIVLANLSLAGIPLLANFPVRVAILQSLSVSSSPTVAWALAGSLGCAIGGIRTLLVLANDTDKTIWKITESRILAVYLLLGLLGLIALGVAPQLSFQ